ncbi:hypothetical protein MWG58_16900 [Streptomyces sp. WAC00276]|uniref:TRADD-N-associated membrane domain-containing protein n=1 Tax=Streptomyces sp. WAC00276 TaxID=2933778 RepID=UPI001FFFC5D5|nr:hypothetical protein [Streptomyces sp. WAC00276]MCK2142610.1 hypothetical protein [Streptomyces sp. WAC00276]
MAEGDGEADAAVEAEFIRRRIQHFGLLLKELSRGIEAAAGNEDASAADIKRMRRQLFEAGSELRTLHRLVVSDDGVVPSMAPNERLGLRHEIERLRDHSDLLRREARRAESLDSQSIVVTGDGSVTINSGAVVQSTQGTPQLSAASTPGPTSSSRRVEFVYGSYEDERKEAKIMFWLSLCVASVAAIFALSAAGLALFQGGPQSTKWVTTFVSTVVAVAGGVWHRHARDARVKLSEHVKRVEKKVEADDHHEKTNARIDRIRDPQMRDRLNAAATIADLGFQANPDTITDHVIGSSSAAAELPPAVGLGDERQDPETNA